MKQQQEQMDAMVRDFQQLKASVETVVDVCEHADLHTPAGHVRLMLADVG